MPKKWQRTTMKAKVYTLASSKGGSGKTILCASFAAFLANIGKKVLMLDVDFSTNGLTLLYLNEVKAHKDNFIQDNNTTIPQGLISNDKFDWNRDIVHLPNAIEFAPATFSFLSNDLPDWQTLYYKISSIIKESQDKFDFIFIDAQAGSDVYSKLVMRKDISHEVIIVSDVLPSFRSRHRTT